MVNAYRRSLSKSVIVSKLENLFSDYSDVEDDEAQSINGEFPILYTEYYNYGNAPINISINDIPISAVGVKVFKDYIEVVGTQFDVNIEYADIVSLDRYTDSL